MFGYLIAFGFDKILCVMSYQTTDIMYFTKVVMARTQICICFITVVLSGQPILLLTYYKCLLIDKENCKIRGGANGKKKVNSKSDSTKKPLIKRKVNSKRIETHNYAFDAQQLSVLQRKMSRSTRTFTDTLSDEERARRFKHYKSSRTSQLPIAKNSCLNFTWSDHNMTYHERDKTAVRCTGFDYFVTCRDRNSPDGFGVQAWRYGSNTCLWDCLFGLFLNCHNVSNELDFDLLLHRFNEASRTVTRNCLNEQYGRELCDSYQQWLSDKNLLMSNDLLEMMCNELSIRVIFIGAHDDLTGNYQSITSYGDGTLYRNIYDPDLIAGVIANIVAPRHFCIVSSIVLHKNYKESQDLNYGVSVKQLFWNFNYKGVNNTAFKWKPVDVGVVIEDVVDVAAELKKARVSAALPSKAETKVEFSRTVESISGLKGDETTIYSKPVEEKLTEEEIKAIDELFGVSTVKKKSDAPVVAKTEESEGEDIEDESSETDGSDEKDSEALEDKEFEPPAKEAKPSVVKEVDRFEGVEGRLVWNIRLGVPTAATLRDENSSKIVEVLQAIFCDDGFANVIYSNRIVRRVIDLTMSDNWFRNLKNFAKRVDVADRVSTLNKNHNYFNRFIRARKQIEGVNQIIDNPCFLKGNMGHHNRKVEDSIQWSYWKTVDAHEVYDYAASVNQIHSKQVLYSAHMVEYVEVDWENDLEIRAFINEMIEMTNGTGITIPRVYSPWYKDSFVMVYELDDVHKRTLARKGYKPFYCISSQLAKRDSDGYAIGSFRTVRCLMNIYDVEDSDQMWDENLNCVDPMNEKQIIVRDVEVRDWNDLRDMEKIMLFASMSSCYKAVTSDFIFDMGITTELTSAKVMSGQNDFESVSKRIDTVAASTIAKFKTNKLTSHFGVNVEMNSVRVAKAIARSYIEKLNLKQKTDELPDFMLRKVKDARPQIKNVSRVYGNGVTLVNRVMKNVIGYRTDEISDMPVIKEVVRNFNICSLKKQRPSDVVIRKITAVTNYNVYKCMSPIPDTNDANNVREGFMKRIGCAVPEPDDSVKMLLPMYVDHFINHYNLDGKITEMLSEEIEKYMNWETYKETLRYNPARLRQLEKIRQEVDILNTFDFSDCKEGRLLKELWTKIEAHVKWESYKGEMKYARLIFARVDWFKTFYGSYAKVMQKCLYLCLEQFCCTNLPVKDLPKHMVEKYSLCSLILSTDFSAFESHNYPWVMYNIFWKFMVRMWGYEFDVELFVSMKILTGTNIIENTFVFCKVDAKVMSGEVWTSIINWITNLIFIFFIVECEGFAYETGFFSHSFAFKFFRGVRMPPKWTTIVFTAAGDDGMTGLIYLSWIDYSCLNKSSYLFFYGVNLKLEMKDSIAGSGFLSKLYSENDMNTLCDPIKQLAKGILPIKYANAKVGVKKALARARAMSLLYEFGGCPVVASYALAVIRCTRNVQMKRALILMQQDDWYSFDKVAEAIEWYDSEVKGKYDSWKVEIGEESRLIIEDNFGIPVCTQRYMEEYFDSVDDTSYPLEFNVPCIDLVCSNVEQEFYEKYTFDRKLEDKSLEICVSYQRERDWIESAPAVETDWFDFLERECFFTVASSA